VSSSSRERWKELVAVFLKLGLISYGGAAMMGIMHAEVAGRRKWLTDARYLEGMAVVNMLPGPPAVQLAIFVGYQRCGLAGGIVAGLCFTLPAFFILLALTLLYTRYGALGMVRDALHGIGAVVLGVFAAALYRLSRSGMNSVRQVLIALAAAALVAGTPAGVAAVLFLGASAGIASYHSRSIGLIAAAAVSLIGVCAYFLPPIIGGYADASIAAASPANPSLAQLAAFFLKASALTFGGGMTILAFVQEHVVNRMQWLTEREFLDGLALGQLTPGPILMIAAYVGYRLNGLAGSILSALCIFAPAFLLLLPIMPVWERFKDLLWIKAAMRGIAPAVIGCLVITLGQLLPHAAPNTFAQLVLLATACALIRWRIGPLPLIVAAGALSILVRSYGT